MLFRSAQTAQRVIIMYAGRAVEEAPVEKLFNEPLHPYTHGLLQSLPRPNAEVNAVGRPLPLAEIAGAVPSPTAMPAGCRFAPRCPHVRDACRQADVPLRTFACKRAAACVRADELLQVAP